MLPWIPPPSWSSILHSHCADTSDVTTIEGIWRQSEPVATCTVATRVLRIDAGPLTLRGCEVQHSAKHRRLIQGIVQRIADERRKTQISSTTIDSLWSGVLFLAGPTAAHRDTSVSKPTGQGCGLFLALLSTVSAGSWRRRDCSECRAFSDECGGSVWNLVDYHEELRGGNERKHCAAPRRILSYTNIEQTTLLGRDTPSRLCYEFLR